MWSIAQEITASQSRTQTGRRGSLDKQARASVRRASGFVLTRLASRIQLAAPPVRGIARPLPMPPKRPCGKSLLGGRHEVAKSPARIAITPAIQQRGPAERLF